MRKVFLDDLPRWDDNRYKDKINWKRCIGLKVRFIYNDIEDWLEIINIEHNRLTLKYKEKIHQMNTGQFGRCELGILIQKRNYENKYPIGTVINDINSGVIKITNHVKIGKKKYKGYNYKCLICGNEDIVSESNLLSGVGCNVCAKKKVLKGYNDLWTTHPHLAKFLKNEEDGYIYSMGSNKKVWWKCPECKSEKLATINDIKSDGYSCTTCGDGISFPEKFVSAILKQLDVDFEREKIFKWSKDKRYDFYIPSLNCIIETHGKQHYDNGFNNIINRSRKLKDEKSNDILKSKLAKENGIKKYIIIDCMESSLEYIKNSILNSELSQLFDLTNIDWIICGEFALNNLVKQACDLWNSGIAKISIISNKLLLSRGCVRNYLKQGTKLGWCSYDADKNFRKYIESKSSKVICLNDGKVYPSIIEASNNYNISESTINNSCSGKIAFNDELLNATYLQWQYYDDYLVKPKNLLSKDELDTAKENNKPKRSVVCINTGVKFNSLKEATMWAKLKTSSTIQTNCVGKIKSAGKHPETGEPLKWMYYEDYIKTYGSDIS